MSDLCLKGKIISFSPHKRRGLIMVRVKIGKGMEYQQLQFDQSHYDSTIETHLFKDQEVEVTLKKITPDTYRVDKINYDIGKNLYKRTRPSNEYSNDRRMNSYDKRTKNRNKTNYRSSDDKRISYQERQKYSSRKYRSSKEPPRKYVHSSERSGTENSQRNQQNKRFDQNRDNKQRNSQSRIQRSNKQKNFNRPVNRNQNYYQKKQYGRRNRYQRDYRSNYGNRRRRIHERLQFLAFFLYYRRAKILRKKNIDLLVKKRNLRYKRRRNILTTYS
ncbi:MAG: hypothetical protein ACFFD1_08875 [Candidatus Thorarchaeota archaeon]